MLANIASKSAFGLVKTKLKGSQSIIINEKIISMAGVNIISQDIKTNIQTIVPLSGSNENFECILGFSGSSETGPFFVVTQYKGSISIFVTDFKNISASGKPVSKAMTSPGEWNSMVFMGIGAISEYGVTVMASMKDLVIGTWSSKTGKLLAQKTIASGDRRKENIIFKLTNVKSEISNRALMCICFDKKYNIIELINREIKVLYSGELENKINGAEWIEDTETILIVTNENEIFSVNSQAVVLLTKTEDSVDCFSALKNGFLCFNHSKKEISLYNEEHGEDDIKYATLVSLYQFSEELPSIVQLQLSIDNSLLYLTAVTGQIFCLPFSSPDRKNTAVKSFKVTSRPVTAAPIGGSVTGFDICPRSPLAVICGQDRNVRIWEYQTGRTLVTKSFPEDTKCVSLHPSGHFMLLTFSDKIQLYSIVTEDLHLISEISLKNCSECAFSRGGHLFAVTSGNNIVIVNMINLQILVTLKGHGSPVKSLSWAKNDNILTSCDTDGAAYCWSMQTLRRINESTLKNCVYTCAVSSPDGKSLYGAASDMQLREIFESQLAREAFHPDVVTQMALSNSQAFLVAGTQNGSIKIFMLPVGSNELPEYRVHSGPIVRLRLSYDDKLLYTASEDGTCLVFAIGEDATSRIVLNPIEEFLATTTDIDEKNSALKESSALLEELRVSQECHIRLREINQNEAVKESKMQFEKQMELLVGVNTSLQEEKEKSQQYNAKELDVLKAKLVSAKKQRETKLNADLGIEYDKYQELALKIEKTQKELASRYEQYERHASHEIKELFREMDTKLTEKQEVIKQLEEEISRETKEKSEFLSQVEKDADMELLTIQKNYEAKIQLIQDESFRLKGENAIIKKKFTSAYKEIEESKNHINRLKAENERILEIIKQLEHEVIHLKKNVQDRDGFIQEKEFNIFELKRANQNLEKHKFVVDHQIKEFRGQIEPKQQDIASMKAYVHDLGRELEDYHTRNTDLQRAIMKSTEDIEKIKLAQQREKEKIAITTKTITLITLDIENCMKSFQDDYQILSGKLSEVFEKYKISDKLIDFKREKGLIDNEWQRQKQVLDHEIVRVKDHLSNAGLAFARDSSNRVRDTMGLIEELSSLRKQSDEQARLQATNI